MKWHRKIGLTLFVLAAACLIAAVGMMPNPLAVHLANVSLFLLVGMVLVAGLGEIWG